MTQPSKGAAVFLTLFGLPFLIGGLAFLYAQLVSRGNFLALDLVVGILIASVFVFIGGGFIYATFRGYALLKQQAAREESNPFSPWQWRTDWALRRAESQNKNSELTLWVITLSVKYNYAAFSLRYVSEVCAQWRPACDSASRLQPAWRDSDRQCSARHDSPSALRQHVLRVRCSAFFSRRTSGRKDSSETRYTRGARHRLAALLRAQNPFSVGQQPKHESGDPLAGGPKYSRWSCGARAARPNDSGGFYATTGQLVHESRQSERSSFLAAPRAGGRARRGLFG